MNKELFSRRVRQLREAKGLTREQFAELVGVSYHQVVKWELGRQTTTVKRLAEIMSVLDVTPEEFWDENYIPGSLFGHGSARGVRIPDVDERQRALRCPRCNAPSSYNADDDAKYCYSCGYPMFNLCVGPEHHINPAHARYCGKCMERTVWSMTEEELQQAGFRVPPFARHGHNTGRNG